MWTQRDQVSIPSPYMTPMSGGRRAYLRNYEQAWHGLTDTCIGLARAPAEASQATNPTWLLRHHGKSSWFADLCACGQAKETIKHSLFRCTRWIIYRGQMLQQTDTRRSNLSFYLGGKASTDPEKWKPNIDAVRTTVNYAIATRRLEAEPEVLVSSVQAQQHDFPPFSFSTNPPQAPRPQQVLLQSPKIGR